MAQITIYLDDELLAFLESATKSAGASQSQWIAEAIRLRINTEWPAVIRELAEAWPDFPTAEEIRQSQVADIQRERL